MTVYAFPQSPRQMGSAAQFRPADDALLDASHRAETGPVLRLLGNQLLALDDERRPLDEGRTVLEALTSELQEAALRTAVVATWANMIASPTPSEPIIPIPRERPTAPPLYLPLARWQASTGLSKSVLHAVDLFFRNLTAPKRSIDELELDAAGLDLDRAVMLHGLLIADHWRASARDAQTALAAVLPHVRRGLHERYTLSARLLTGILQSAASGETPCINEAGELKRPELPQRRSSSRKYLGEDVILKVSASGPMTGSDETVLYTAHAVNISIGGLGIIRVPHMPIGAHVEVFMPSGRSLGGMIAWHNEDAAGIRWKHELPRSDPLVADMS